MVRCPACGRRVRYSGWPNRKDVRNLAWLGTSVHASPSTQGFPSTTKNRPACGTLRLHPAEFHVARGLPNLCDDQLLPKVRNRNVLRASRRRGLPLNHACPFLYPPTTYFHPKRLPPLSPML